MAGAAGRCRHRPLRVHSKRCGESGISQSRLCRASPFRQGGRGDGGTDCHSQCAHWLRNDMVFHGCGARPGGGVTRGAVKRGVGEIGEAPPVAEEASRFRGSAPIGGHNSGRESVGTTVGNRRPLWTVTWGTVQRATARVAPTDVLQGARWGGPMPTSAPTHHLALEFRRGGALPRPRATARVAPTENMRYGGGGTHGSRPL